MCLIRALLCHKLCEQSPTSVHLATIREVRSIFASMSLHLHCCTCIEAVNSAAAIWSLADIAYIAIYRDMSKISRYNIAIFLSIFIEQLLIINHTIFMQVEAVLLWWRHKNKRLKCYLAREGGGRRKGEKRHCTNWYTYTGIHE